MRRTHLPRMRHRHRHCARPREKLESGGSKSQAEDTRAPCLDSTGTPDKLASGPSCGPQLLNPCDIARCTVSPYTKEHDHQVRRHRALRKLLENNDARLLQPILANRVRNVMTVLILAKDMSEFIANAPPGWRVHPLSRWQAK